VVKAGESYIIAQIQRHLEQIRSVEKPVVVTCLEIVTGKKIKLRRRRIVAPTELKKMTLLQSDHSELLSSQ
jgi:hypothetical protein